VVTATADYASPEQLLNQPIDARSDLYSLGCVVYQLLTGRTPFTGPLTSQISQHLHATPAPPSAHHPAVKPALDRLVLHLLAKSPSDRPESARAALRELEAIDATDELDQLQSQKLASLGNLVAGIAHELNTPLGALQANVDVLQRAFGILSDALADEELGDMLRRNERVGRALATLEKTRGVTPEATQRIARIVRDLKSFARLDQATEESVDVRVLLEQTIAVLKSDLERITIVREFAEVPALRCKPQELNQVFYNLMVNAIQAIREQGTITLSVSQEAGSIVVRVADTGAGIKREHLARIFDPGFTTKGVGVGVGLGLSIAYRIVESHGGTITAESEGEGSVLTVRLPL
jgi:signal transduction histidine kinase